MAEPEHIYHWLRLDECVTTSGQPSEAELAELAALGVRHVVNLAPHDHEKALRDEAGAVERLGMSYVNIPVDFKAPSEDDFRQFCQLMQAYEGVPVHVHCAANYRVSAFFCRYRRAWLGVDEARTRADLEQIWQPNAAWAAFIAND